MEKLIMLIDIYEEEVVWVHSVWDKIIDKDEARIISKQFWFIKRLVENDKIDFDKRPTRNKYRLQQYKTELWWYGKIDEYSELLMLLSISDNPIEDLIRYLK